MSSDCTHPQLAHCIWDPPATAQGGVRVEELCMCDGWYWGPDLTRQVEHSLQQAWAYYDPGAICGPLRF